MDENGVTELNTEEEELLSFEPGYEERFEKREELLRERRAVRKKAQEKKRLIVLGIIGLSFLTLLGLLIFFLVKDGASGRKEDGKKEKKDTSEELFSVLSDKAETDSEASGNSEGNASGDPAGYVSGDPADSGSGADGNDGENGDNASLRSHSGGYLGERSAPDGPTVTVGDGIELYAGYDVNHNTSPLPFVEEGIYSTHGILIDGKTGDVIRSTDGAAKIYPASMTKIMTVYTAARHLSEEQLEDKVTITIEETDFVFRNGLSAVNFDRDETVTVRDLFYGTVLPSGADAAMALAKYVAGDVDSFVALMNEEVRDLGLSRTTHFTNCVGLYDENNYSTCADMAMILKAAVENEFCYDVLNAHRYTTSPTEQHPEGIEISNWFLRRIEDHYDSGEVLCAKTGFVVESRNCAASFAVTNAGHPYFCVTADGGSSWQAIFDHAAAYENYVK